MRSLAFGSIMVFFAAACGGNKSSTPDAAPVDALVHAVCGNNKVEPGEQCDDGNSETDLVCDSTCHFTCGNGTVDTAAGETCDTGITGSCPTGCDDGMACTSDVLSGSDCQAACLHT